MDRNSIIGLLLIGAILIGWMYWTAPSKEEIAKRKHQQDSIAAIQKPVEQTITKAKPVTPLITDTTITQDSAKAIIAKQQYGALATAMQGKEDSVVLENEFMKINLSSLGGRISSVQLKNYKTHSGKPLFLFHGDSAKQTLEFRSNNKQFSTDALYFKVTKPKANQVVMRLYGDTESKYLEYSYTLPSNSYMVTYNLNIVGFEDIIESKTLTLNWSMNTPHNEKSLDNEREASTIYYKYTEEKADYISESSFENLPMEGNVKWVGYKQQFFSSVLIADNAFEKPSTVETKSTNGSTNYVKNFSSSLAIPYNHKAAESFGMQFYFGPNHYKTLKQFDLELEKQVPLGWGIFGWVNKFLVIPLFTWLNSFNLNFGIVILILTICFKIILFPIAYKTYLSSAKMRVLKPEIDELNAKYGSEDPMKKQQAMMSLYKKAGINPMAGCIPLLLQMPILIALVSFFPASIELRQESFLWAEDLSTYDSVWDFGFHIPGYGDHMSMFALLMTISSLVYTYYNSQMMVSSNQMPGMKWMMYLMPLLFLGFLNSRSAALSYYYLLANIISILQTIFMQRFIDENALHAQIQENKKKPVKVSRFQQKLEEMAKQRQQIQAPKKK